ncbi:MAG: ATP-binding protein [Elusimicrobiota bacterium]|nr:MAG: ATP-binding protein [Elusimicrobiota bacterium]
MSSMKPDAGFDRHLDEAFARVQRMASIGCWRLDLTRADIDSNALEWSDGLFLIFGYEPRSVPVTNALFFEAVHPDDRPAIAAAVAEALRTRKPYVIEHRIKRRDGAERWILEHADVVCDPATGRPLHLFGTAQDVTERRALEDLEAFSYAASHDLRAPLAILRRHSERLSNSLQGRLDAEENASLAKIDDSARRMELLIEDLLVLGRLSKEEPARAAVALDALWDDLVGQNPRFAAARARKPLGSVAASEPMLALAISNLVANALKFVAPGSAPDIEVYSEKHAGVVRLSVRDRGIGIAGEYQDKIFRPFLRLHSGDKYPGNGIGLAIVRKTVERMGGRVGVDSEPGKGSTFWLELPAA